MGRMSGLLHRRDAENAEKAQRTISLRLSVFAHVRDKSAYVARSTKPGRRRERFFHVSPPFLSVLLKAERRRDAEKTSICFSAFPLRSLRLCGESAYRLPPTKP